MALLNEKCSSAISSTSWQRAGKDRERFKKKEVVKESSLTIRKRIYQANITGSSGTAEYPFEICGYKFAMNPAIEVFFSNNVLMLYVVAA